MNKMKILKTTTKFCLLLIMILTLTLPITVMAQVSEEAETSDTTDTENAAVPDDATPITSATATTIEEAPDGTGSVTDASSEEKQFVVFETKSGKVFYLIIDNTKTADNVYLLTEVSENDLLNFVETETDGTGNSVIGDTLTDSPSTLPNNLEDDTPSTEETTQTESSSDSGSKPSASGNLGIIMIFIIGVVGIAGYYYFKIYKPKKELIASDEFIEDDDYDLYEDDENETDIDHDDTISEDETEETEDDGE